MREPQVTTNLVDELAEEFARRLRAGEQPSVEEFVARHPVLAEQIRSVLDAVAIMEQLKPGCSAALHPRTGRCGTLIPERGHAKPATIRPARA